MNKNSIINRYARGAHWLLVFYLSFALSGCSFRPEVLSPEEARVLQTRELIGTPEEIARGVIVVLQEMHYTLGNVDMGLGMITAERSSERRLAKISREPISQEEIDDGVKTFFIVAGVIVVVGFILALVFGDDDDDDEDNDDDRRSYRSRRHHRPSRSSTTYIGSDHYSDDSYLYTMTVTLEEIVPQQTRIRVTVQGQHLEGSSISESGPVQTKEFYADFFNRLQLALNR